MKFYHNFGESFCQRDRRVIENLLETEYLDTWMNESVTVEMILVGDINISRGYKNI